MDNKSNDKKYVFETMPVPKALTIMALPTVISQVIVLAYNIADTWFIGRTDNPYMIGAASLVLALFLSMAALSNLFGVGGGSLMVRLMGQGDTEEARKTASYSISMSAIFAVAFSLFCLVLMDPILRLLGASDNTLEYSRQYLLFTVVIGGLPTVLSLTMPMILRNAGYAKEAGIGVSIGGLLNIALDPLFMFVILPDGYQVLGAALATLISNIVSMIYFILVYLTMKDKSVLQLPKRIEKLRPDSLKSFYSVGIPAAVILLLFNSLNIVANRLIVSYGDIPLAAIGIVMKIERFPINIGLGVCLGMVPLVAYSFAQKNYKRMDSIFSAARITILAVAVISMVVSYFFAEPIVHSFINEPETIRLGTEFLKARCFDMPFVIIGFQIVNYMQAVNQGKMSFALTIIRHLVLNIPALIIMNMIWGMTGLIWAQAVSDVINSVIACIIYYKVRKKITAPEKENAA